MRGTWFGLTGVVALAVSVAASADERSLAVLWDGVAGPIAGIVERHGEPDARIRIRLSDPERECLGTLSVPKESQRGSWAIACPDGMAASGSFTRARGEGTGSDLAGRRIVLVIGPPVRTLARPAKSGAATPSRVEPTADELNQAEVEHRRAEREQQRQEAARQNPPPARSPSAVPGSRPASGPVELAAAPGNVLQCGFIRVEGLPVRPGTPDCKPDKRVGQGGDLMLTIEIASLAVRLEPNNTLLFLYGEKDVDGRGGFRTSGDEQLRKSAESWAGAKAGRNYSNVSGGPFRHVKLNITENGDWACAWGQIESAKRAWGGGGVRAYAFVRYCERGSHTVSEGNLRKVAAAVQLD